MYIMTLFTHNKTRENYTSSWNIIYIKLTILSDENFLSLQLETSPTTLPSILPPVANRPHTSSPLFFPKSSY